MAAIVPKMLPKRLSGEGPVLHVRDADANCITGNELMYFRACDGAADLVLGCAELSNNTGDQLPLFVQLTRPVIERSGDPLLQRLFTTMLDELRNPRLGSRAFVSTLMKQVLIVLLRSQPNGDSSHLLMTDARLAGAVAAILNRPENSHTVKSLAAIAGMSRSSFCHHFTEAYNLSPKAFVQEARLASAARILKASDLPVKSIAASVGYASRSHFSRVFQTRFGIAPTAFRRSSLSSSA
jgi:AraC-like DNA-binding protein